MAPIWSSSESPISVRTIWVDGVRHAILTHDDPILIRQRSQSLASPVKSKSHSIEYIANPNSVECCFVNFRVNVNKKDEEVESKHVIRRQSAPVHSIGGPKLLNFQLNGILKITDNNYGNNNIASATNKMQMDFNRCSTGASIKTCEASKYNRNNAEVGGNCVMFSDISGDSPDMNGMPNSLSERVYQWMNLSGRDKVRSEKKEIPNKHDIEHGKSLVRAKVCSFRKPNSAVSQNIVNIQQYKLSLKKSKGSMTQMNAEKNAEKNSMKNPSAAFLNGTKDDSPRNKPSAISRSLWSSLGKPQLHIFMPDLNSNREDRCFQDTWALGDFLEQSSPLTRKPLFFH